MSVRYPIVLLDVDGTLVDSAGALRTSLEETLRELGLPEATEELHALAMRGTSDEVFAFVGAKDIPAAIKVWNRNYSRAESSLYPGVREAVAQMKELGCRMALVTSRSIPECEQDLVLAPILPMMETWVCVEDTETHKPSPEPILLALCRLGATPEQAVYFGDSPTDAMSASAAGVDFALARWGSRPGAEIPARYALNHAGEMVGVVKGNG